MISDDNGCLILIYVEVTEIFRLIRNGVESLQFSTPSLEFPSMAFS